MNEAYAPLDNWKWTACLWRGCIGPDITIYIRESESEETASNRHGGGLNLVDVHLNDAGTIVVRRPPGSPGNIEEKALKRVGFELVDYLTQ